MPFSSSTWLSAARSSGHPVTGLLERASPQSCSHWERNEMSCSLDRALAWPLGGVPPALTYPSSQPARIPVCTGTPALPHYSRLRRPAGVPSGGSCPFLVGAPQLPPLLPGTPGLGPAAWSSGVAAPGGSLAHCVCASFSHRTSTSRRLTKKRCIFATSISFVTCICRRKTTQVSARERAVPPGED